MPNNNAMQYKTNNQSSIDRTLSENLKVFGFIMTCFIVIMHTGHCDSFSALFYADSIIKCSLNSVFDMMGKFAMYYFFSVTGFLLYRGLSYQTWLSKMKHRVYSLLIPYFIWQCVTYLFDILQHQQQLSIILFIKRMFLLVCWPFDGALWYVYAVFLLALISPVFLWAYKSKKSGFLFIGIAVIIAENVVRISTFDGIACNLVPVIISYLPAYLVGTFLGYFSDEDIKENLLYIVCLLLFAFAVDGLLGGGEKVL